MTEQIEPAAGWLLTGFQAMVGLSAWMVAVVVYGFFWRSWSCAEPDPIRPSGPLD